MDDVELHRLADDGNPHADPAPPPDRPAAGTIPVECLGCEWVGAVDREPAQLRPFAPAADSPACPGCGCLYLKRLAGARP